jgi:hypothetical protein
MAKKKQLVHLPDEIEYATLAELYLDPRNPRLGRSRIAKELSQEQILKVMQDWTLDELGTSFCESGFWPQEALIAVKEKIVRSERLVVVEGNRRLAALQMIDRTVRGEETGKLWRSIVEATNPERLNDLRERIPYMLMPNREEIQSYLGFRHVTGIKEWFPAEKAQFIAELIERDGLSYEQVRKRIGSKLPTVRTTYIAYRLLRQMEDHSDTVDVERVEERFSVLSLSLRTDGVRKYLKIDIEADPKTASKPVPKSRIQQLENFARWLFGDSKSAPIVSDSRRVDDFGRILASSKGVDYLERTEKPSFDVAKRMAGVSEEEVATHIETAADEAQEALRVAHHHKDSTRVREAVLRLVIDSVELARLFPTVMERARKEIQ